MEITSSALSSKLPEGNQVFKQGQKVKDIGFQNVGQKSEKESEFGMQNVGQKSEKGLGFQDDGQKGGTINVFA